MLCPRKVENVIKCYLFDETGALVNSHVKISYDRVKLYTTIVFLQEGQRG